jgi:hypothetical protein
MDASLIVSVYPGGFLHLKKKEKGIEVLEKSH